MQMGETLHTYLETRSSPMCRPIFHKIVYSVFSVQNSIPYVLPSEVLFTGSLPRLQNPHQGLLNKCCPEQKGVIIILLKILPG